MRSMFATCLTAVVLMLAAGPASAGSMLLLSVGGPPHPPAKCHVGKTSFAVGSEYRCSKAHHDKCGQHMCMTCKPDGTWTPASECHRGPLDPVLPDPTPKHGH